MKIIIHRGASEIGGTVIQLLTANTNILLDIGLPLSLDSKPIDITQLKPDAVFISHPHQDHYGLVNELTDEVPVYIGELGKNLIEATKMFLGKELNSNHFQYISDRKTIKVGDFSITPYLVDHSAVDAYSFLVEAEGKRVFYSGDFRAHGRKSILFDRLIANPPKDVDVLLMEGTMLKRSNSDFPSEAAVEEKIVETIRDQSNISFLVCSSQNIDRIVSAYRACLRTGKKLVVDFYTAWILEQVKSVSQSVPNVDWDYVCLYADYRPDQIVKDNLEYFGDFRKRAYASRVTKEELQSNPSDYVVISKMSKHKVINLYRNFDKPVNVIYSQWLGYLDCLDEEYFGAEAVSRYRGDAEVSFVYAHTSGHAVLDDLKQFADAVKPQNLIPIHTEYGDNYEDHFSNVVKLSDNECHDV
ncbi:MBL fold metallo-hydrolase [Desulfopila aestuarii]|uniref:Ribonuclease J n=1 Tax=Desulfopila aestuarii DSM 18488 TaxID=1121416 RepID=A0A1M7Y993_9BACT|nr:MBL fold metallo-hydrolase [Desulfopila aestuarii]SHO49204.1 ribonuclease J [Desulfopila aestuarii DSM 18488]